MDNIEKIIEIRKPRVSLSKMFNHNIDNYFGCLKEFEEVEGKKGKYKFLEEPSEITKKESSLTGVKKDPPSCLTNLSTELALPQPDSPQ